MVDFSHITVLANEAIEKLNLQPKRIYVDGTLGGGGHSKLLISQLDKDSKLISFDQDQEVVKRITNEAKAYKNWILTNRNFADIENYCLENNLKINGGLLLDLGLSSIQLDDPLRGFSFDSDQTLDMRMDQSASLTAAEVVNKFSEKKLADILYTLGEEKKSRQIASLIINNRPFSSCQQLASLIKNYFARFAKGKTFRIHPATKTFQALRIFVNQELEVLEKVLKFNPSVYQSGARIVIISFHSLEDRIVKHRFRELAKADALKIITKKPIIVSEAEISQNPRSRSAKMRVAEII